MKCKYCESWENMDIDYVNKSNLDYIVVMGNLNGFPTIIVKINNEVTSLTPPITFCPFCGNKIK